MSLSESIEGDCLSIPVQKLRGCVDPPKSNINEGDECPVEATDSHITKARRSLRVERLNIVVIQPVEAICHGVGEVESSSGLVKSRLKSSSVMRHSGLLM
jgi:hypothetical protein